MPSSPTGDRKQSPLTRLPLVIALVLVAIGGFYLLDKADKQARDTTRKHHLQDIEQALYFARSTNGTYPPYDQAHWCGSLNDPENRQVRDQVEEVLRAQNDKYENVEKPFPFDPNYNQQGPYDYFYWKRSPAVFELYAVLETDKNGEKNSFTCENATPQRYDYGITSRWRENTTHLSS